MNAMARIPATSAIRTVTVRRGTGHCSGIRRVGGLVRESERNPDPTHRGPFSLRTTTRFLI